MRIRPVGVPLDRNLRKAVVYSDCWGQDSRLVVLNALGAAERGAQILTRTACVSARRLPNVWQATLRSTRDGSEWSAQARCLVNATGPWVSRFLDENLQLPHARSIRLVKGSHIVLPRLFDHDDHEYAYMFQNPDRRIVFAIPYEEVFTLIGTTEVVYEGDPSQMDISPDEITYLCTTINRYVSRNIVPEDVVWTYAGVRPLYDDASENVSAITRDYELDLDAGGGDAPLLSVLGGKMTIYRKLAEHALAKLLPVLGITKPAWTATAPLPGGDIAGADFDTFLAGLKQSRPWLPAPLARHYARQYGTRAEAILGHAKGLGDLGEDLGDGVYEAELEYLLRCEWAQTSEDILWRRSRKGLHISDATAARLANWFASHQNDINIEVQAP